MDQLQASKIIIIKNIHFNTKPYGYSSLLDKVLLDQGFQKETLSDGFVEVHVHPGYQDDNLNTIVYVSVDDDIITGSQQTFVEGPKRSRFMDATIPQGYKVEFKNRKINDYDKAWDVEGSSSTMIDLVTEHEGRLEKQMIKREDIIAITDAHGTRRS